MNILINGILLGLGYCLIAMGMSLILGVAKVFDVAYASYYMVAVYVIAILVPIMVPNIPLLLIFIIGVMAAVALAEVIHYVVILPLRKQPTAILVSTLALAMVIQELLIFKEGSEPVVIPRVLQGATRILGIWVENGRLLVAGVTITLIVLLWLFFSRTRVGLAIRATAEQPEALQLVGGDIRHVWLTTVFLAALLAGIGGILLGSIYPPSPYVWLELLIVAFAVMVLGGLGNIWAVLPASLILGISEVAVAIYIPFGGIVKRSVGLVIILLVLVLRPTGLFGVKGWEEE